MTGLRLLPLGVGGAFSAIHYTTSLALEAEGAWLLLDCPHPIRKMMREASLCAGLRVDVGDVVAVALTHLHADHSSGLEDFAYYGFFMLKRRTRLVVHPAVASRLWEGHLAGGMEQIVVRDDEEPQQKGLADYFEVLSLDEANPVRIGPFLIECRRTLHAVPTTALRVRAGDRTLGFSADTAFDPGLIDWLSSADIIVHEVTYSEHSGLHTPYDRLAGLPEEVRNRMRLIHYPDNFDLDQSCIEPLRQGKCYEL